MFKRNLNLGIKQLTKLFQGSYSLIEATLPRTKNEGAAIYFKEESKAPSSIKDKKISNSSLVNIKNLPKERVLIALFNNAYKKSTASYRTWMSIADHVYFGGSKAPIGTDFPPSEYEARKILSEVNFSKRKNYIDYVGAVMFKIDFNSDIIDTTNYDKEHETSSNPKIKPAIACLNQLRITIELEQKKAAEEEIRRRAEAVKEQKLINTANTLINKILEKKDCRITDAYLRIIQFNSKQSFESLKQYAEKLTSAGLSVKVEKESSLLGGLTTIPANLELGDPLETIVDKLSAHFSQFQSKYSPTL